MVKQLLLLSSFLFLTSCSFLSPVKTKPDSSYMIASIPSVAAKKPRKSSTLMILLPDTVPAYNTTDMAYSCREFEIAYFAKNRWAETPSQMFLPLMVQTIQNTRHFRAIVAPPSVGQYDYILATTILKLQQDYTCIPAKLKLRVRAQITSASTNRVIATKEFCIREPICQPCPYGGVIAANRAAKRFLGQLASFTVKKLSH